MSERGAADEAGPGVTDPDPDLTCGSEPDGSPPGTSSDRWAAPGVPRSEVPVVLPAALSSVLTGLAEQVAADPSALSGRQALAELAAALEVGRLADRLLLRRTADVDARKLARQDGARSLGQWVEQHGGGVSAQQLTVARRLSTFPVIGAALLAGTLTLTAGHQLQGVLGRLRPHLDPADGLLDGHDAEEVVTATIVDGIAMVLAQARGGFPTSTDPVLTLLRVRLPEIAALAVPQRSRLEHALVLLAQHVEPAQLPGALEVLVAALLPSRLEEAAEAARSRRFLTLTRAPDGGGWTLSGRLDLLTGERLQLVLDAALRADPDKALDTATAADLREQGLDPHDPDLAPTLTPRNRGQRRHDALDHALTAHLGADLAGSHDKNPVQLGVLLTQRTLDGAPGALPAITSTGTLLPASIWQALACGGAFTRLVMDLRGKVIETSHTSRTLKPHERKALHAQTVGRCQGAGCTRSSRHAGTVLHPHHADPWSRCGTTSLHETTNICDSCHHHVHHGHPLRLKDGRLLGPDGWIDA